MTRVMQASSLESKSPKFGIKDPKNHGMQKRKDLMVKIGKLVQKFEKSLFGMNSLKK
jgi:hypothetical protein